MPQTEPGSLLAILADVPDPRARSGRRHPLVAMLAHASCPPPPPGAPAPRPPPGGPPPRVASPPPACCPPLCGGGGSAPIAQWGRAQPIELMPRLGYRRTPPAYGTFQGLFSRLDAA